MDREGIKFFKEKRLEAILIIGGINTGFALLNHQIRDVT